MFEHASAAEQLATLLEELGAEPRIARVHVGRSVLYDLDYHVALVACAFATNGQERADGTRSVVAPWLKMLQFVATRPSLLSAFQEWARDRRKPSTQTWQRMPRGFLGDETHDRTVELLVADGYLYRDGDSLVGGKRFAVLNNLYSSLRDLDLLSSERDVLLAMARFPANKTLLRGQ